MSTDTVIFRKYFDFEGIWQKFLKPLALTDIKKAFHIQYPGELINLHIDKQYEMNDDPSQVARFFIFLEDWKPGHAFGIDDKIIIHWKKYDYYVWDSTVEHWGGNFGSEDRYTLQLTGQIKE